MTLRCFAIRFRRGNLKRLYAFLAALIVTGIVALCMLVIGVSAAMNPNTVPIADSPSDPAAASASSPAQIDQMQSLIQQYQNREKQYQTQLNQMNTQLQQYQSLLQDLQRRGIIRINADGSYQLLVRGANRSGGDSR